MIVQLFILSILPILSISIDFYDNKKNKQTNKINFYELSKKDSECLMYYESNVVPYTLDNSKVSFDEYLEYWWNTEENGDELLKRVCNYIYHKFLKRYLKVPRNKN
jgi:hypothetical protein